MKNVKMEAISREALVAKIKDIGGGKIWSCKFIKRTNNELREMTCAQNVEKHLKGGTLNYDPVEKGLIPTFDMELVRKMSPEDLAKRPPYRSIPIEGILEARIDGVVYTVVENLNITEIPEETSPVKVTNKKRSPKKVTEAA